MYVYCIDIGIMFLFSFQIYVEPFAFDKGAMPYLRCIHFSQNGSKMFNDFIVSQCSINVF